VVICVLGLGFERSLPFFLSSSVGLGLGFWIGLGISSKSKFVLSFLFPDLDHTVATMALIPLLDSLDRLGVDPVGIFINVCDLFILNRI
jgi:hypothetical protein